MRNQSTGVLAAFRRIVAAAANAGIRGEVNANRSWAEQSIQSIQQHQGAVWKQIELGRVA